MGDSDFSIDDFCGGISDKINDCIDYFVEPLDYYVRNYVNEELDRFYDHNKGLTIKFWELYNADKTQDFLSSACGLKDGAKPPFTSALDALMLVEYGHGIEWRDRPAILPKLEDIDMEDLRWDEWVKFDETRSYITNIKSNNFYKERQIDFKDDEDTMNFYGYDTAKHPDGIVSGKDCIQHLTLHHTAENIMESINTLTDPNRPLKDSCGNPIEDDDGKIKLNRVSANFVVSHSGMCYNLVDTENAAWHAGGGSFFDWDCKPGLYRYIPNSTKIPGGYNNYSIGIEIVDQISKDAIGKVPEFTKWQEDRVADLCVTLKNDMHSNGRSFDDFGQYHIVSHGEVDAQRKRDVNYKFHWKVLEDEGLIDLPTIDCKSYAEVLYEFNPAEPMSDCGVKDLRIALRKVGINVPIHNDESDYRYDKDLARCAWQLKAKYDGRNHPELCSFNTSMPYVDGDSDMNLNWYKGHSKLLKAIVEERYDDYDCVLG